MTQPIKDYLKNKEARMLTPYHYNGETGQKGYILNDGVLMSEESIKEMYPLGNKIVPSDFNNKGENPDKTRII